MKRIVLIILILLAGIGGWLYFFERELLNTWMGQQPPTPTALAPGPKPATKKTPSSKSAPVTMPEKAKPMATLTIPSSDGSVFVNGIAVKAGSQIQIPVGTSVIASYNNDGSYSHELIKGEAEGAYSAQLTHETQGSGTTWTTFQGNEARTGFVSAHKRDAFDPLWQVDLKDKVTCSPVLIGETAFLSSRKSLIVAINLTKGAVLWKQGVSGSSISPIGTDNFVFAANNMGQFGGYRQEDGKQKGELFLNSYPTGLALVSAEAFLVSTIENKVFSVKTKKSWRGKLPLKTNWEIELPELASGVGAPVIATGAAIFQTESGLLAINLSTGERRWPTTAAQPQGEEMVGNMSLALRDESHFQTPTPTAVGKIVYAVLGKNLQAVNAEDGKVLWQRSLAHKVTSSLSHAHGMLFFGTKSGAIEARSTFDGSPIFATNVSGMPVFASPVLFKDRLIAATGEGGLKMLHCFSGQVLAESKALAGAPITSTPAVTDRCILAVNSKGLMVCFK